MVCSNKPPILPKMKIIKLICLLLLINLCAFAQQTATIKIDAKIKIGDMYPVWAWFGHDEPNYTYMKDGRKLIASYKDLQANAKKKCFLNE